MIQMQLVKADGKAEYALLEQLAARSGEVDRPVSYTHLTLPTSDLV